MHISSLCHHKKKCNYKENDKYTDCDNQIINTNEDTNEDTNKINNNMVGVVNNINDIANNDYKSLVIKLISENQELRNVMQKENKALQKQITELIPIIGNNNNNTINNVKQRFNINIFLNEKCKNAMSIDQFVEKIEVSMKNLLATKDHGLGIGLSNIIIDNMNKLSLYERPMHCTDKKRETLYIKNNEWEKDCDKEQLTILLKRVENKQIKSIKKWTDEHPNFLDDEKLQEEYMNLIRGCTTSIEACKEKAIKKICENVYVTE